MDLLRIARDEITDLFERHDGATQQIDAPKTALRGPRHGDDIADCRGGTSTAFYPLTTVDLVASRDAGR